MITVLGAGEGVVSSVDFASLVSALTGMVSMGEIIGFLSLGLGGAGVFFLGWMGVRKLVRMITNSVKSGRVSV